MGYLFHKTQDYTVFKINPLEKPAHYIYYPNNSNESFDAFWYK